MTAVLKGQCREITTYDEKLKRMKILVNTLDSEGWKLESLDDNFVKSKIEKGIRFYEVDV